MRNCFRLLLLALAVLTPRATLQAQNGCVPPPLAASHTANIFTPALESVLGDIATQQLGGEFRVIEDDAVTGYLRRIGERLAQHLPANQVRFRFFVYDSGELNAFSLPGGGVYVSRKLIATVRSEDELAGVLAHEMGHELAGHAGKNFTLLFRRVLNITAVKDAPDLVDKYHQLLDTYLEDPGRVRDLPDNEAEEQMAADQVGVYATALSGYSPAGVAQFWDRTAGLKGQAGGWASDLFGTTRPGGRRLREIQKDIRELPQACLRSERVNSPEDFRRWQSFVIAYSGLGRQEQLHNVARRELLIPGLREPLQYLRFSPDGKHILAQDTASIYVLTREPLRERFRIPAHQAEPAQFTPDSQSIVFYDRSLRVEKWSIPREHMDSVDEIHTAGHCAKSALSPDGKFLACLYFETGRNDLGLTVFDVASGDVTYSKKGLISSVFVPWSLLLSFGELFSVGELQFSPDARYLLAVSGNSRVALDLSAMKEVRLPSSVRDLVQRRFGFLPGNRLVGLRGSQGEKSAIVRFPTGEVEVASLPLGFASFHGGSGDYLLIGNLKSAARGLYSVKAKKIVLLSRTEALDVYDGMLITELSGGELALCTGDWKEPTAKATLPAGPMGSVRAAAVSPDLRWLALSTAERGAVWDLQTRQLIVNAAEFHGIAFRDDAFVLIFPPVRFPLPEPGKKPLTPEERSKLGDSVVRFDLRTNAATVLKEYNADTETRQVGPYLLLLARDADKHTTTFEVRDATTLTLLWSRPAERFLALRATNEHPESFVLLRDLNDAAAKREVKADADLSKTTAGIRNREHSYLVEVVDSKTGKTLGKFPVVTHRGSFRLADAVTTGDFVVFTDLNHRVLLYSLHGERKGQMFGDRPVISRDGTRLCVEHGAGRLTVYELPSLRPLDQFTFATRVLYTGFSADNQKLLVVTDDQTAFVLGIVPPSGATTPISR